jgi:hypothetical protein
MKKNAVSLKKISKFDKLLAKLTERRKENTCVTKTGDEKGDITTDTNKFHKILQEYFENLYSSKLENEEYIYFLTSLAHQN